MIARGATLLRRFLEQHELTQLQAAKALSVTDPAVHDWISGAKRPRAQHRAAIERWTRGAVPSESWLFDLERSVLDQVQPFSPPRTRPSRPPPKAA